EMIERPLVSAAALAGIEDPALRVREPALALADDPRHAVTRHRLTSALDAVSAALETTPPTPAAWAVRLAELDAGARMVVAIAHALIEEDGDTALDVAAWAEALRACVESHARDAAAVEPGGLDGRVTALAERARAWVSEMDFAFLFDPMRKLFSIGYRVAEGSLDPGCYDLLASEARLTSFLAVAKGDVPVSHWFRLGRALTPVERDSVLVSWSGSMFEYLMPFLVMRAPAGSLLEQTGRLAVRRQI